MKKSIATKLYGVGIAAVLLVNAVVPAFPVVVNGEEAASAVQMLSENISWSYDTDDNSEEALIISGTGDIPAAAELGLESFPWSELSFSTIYIENGITGIPSGFYSGSHMYIELSGSVDNVAESAFTGLDMLMLTVYNDDCIFAENAFVFASDNYNGGVYSYDNSTAYELAESYGLDFVSMGNKISGTYSDESFSYYVYDDYAILTDFKGTETEAVIPAELDGRPVTVIAENAFNRCSELESVVIPDTVTSIAASAFNECTSLTEISAPSVLTIGEKAFKDCTALVSVHLGSSLESIGIYAFSGCTALAEISIPDTVSSIGSYAFENTGLVSVVLPESLTVLESDVFKDCLSLETLLLPSGLEVAYYSAFCDTPACDDIQFGEETEVIAENMDFQSTGETDIVIPDYITTMHSFSCIGYETVTLGRNVREFIVPAFETGAYNDPFLKAIYVSEDNPYFSSENGILYNKDKTELVYVPFRMEHPDGVLTIPSSVSSIRCGLYSRKIEQFEVEEGNTVYSAADGVLMDIQQETIIQYPAGSKESNYTVPDGTLRLAEGSFYMTYLDSVIIPESVRYIESGVFWATNMIFLVFDHTADSALDIADDFHGYYSNGTFFGSDVTYYAYEGSIIESMFPDNFVSRNAESSGICGEDLSWAKNDLELIISGTGSMTKCAEGKYPWSFLPYTKVTFEGSNIEIAESAFEQNNHLFDLDLTGVTTIDKYAFRGCSNLRSITGDEAVEMVKADAFEETKWLPARNDESGFNILGSVLMKSFSGEEVVIPDNITYVSSRAFTGIDIDTLYVPESGVVWNRNSFINNTSLQHLRFIGSEEDITLAEFRAAAENSRPITLTDQNGNTVTGSCYTSENTLMQLADAVSETPYMDRYNEEFCRVIAEKMQCTAGMSDLELITALYTYCKNNTSYGFWYTEAPDGIYTDGEKTWEMSANLSHQSTGIMITGEGVCSSYAELVNTFVRVLQEDGLTDTLKAMVNTGLNHEWNAVGLDTGTENEKWYYLDLSNGTYLIGYENGIITSNPAMFSYDSSLAKNENGTYTVTLQNGTVIALESADLPVPEMPAVKGDITCDGIVGLEDASAILAIYASHGAGVDSGYTAEQTAAADIDGDGEVTLDDASAVLLYYAMEGAGLDVSWDEILAA